MARFLHVKWLCLAVPALSQPRIYSLVACGDAFPGQAGAPEQHEPGPALACPANS